MEYLQYADKQEEELDSLLGFKPCYKWNTFNTLGLVAGVVVGGIVLNLVISGIPSIHYNQKGSWCYWEF